MLNNNSDNSHWIHSADELDRWLDSAPGKPLAVDTEFERVSTFFPIPGLVQLGLGEQFYLVDPDVAESSGRFRAILQDPDTPKLFYAMSEDLELFRQWLNVQPAGVVDLQIGAALAGAGFSVGYARLVETLFGKALDKSATRSDWISRPLTPQQEQYALDDVRFLGPLNQWVEEKLLQKGLLPALAEESARFADDLYAQDDPDLHYLKLRGGWALDSHQQCVLQRLTRWREDECRARNRPRNRILPDAMLIAMAEALPQSKGALQAIPGMPSVVIRKYGAALLELIQQVSDDACDDIQRVRPPLSRDQQKTYKRLKQVFVAIAAAQDVPIELLAPRKRLESLVQRGGLACEPLLQGWRGELTAPVIDDIKAVLEL